jgi:hypothetical protein
VGAGKLGRALGDSFSHPVCRSAPSAKQLPLMHCTGQEGVASCPPLPQLLLCSFVCLSGSVANHHYVCRVRRLSMCARALTGGTSSSWTTRWVGTCLPVALPACRTTSRRWPQVLLRASIPCMQGTCLYDDQRTGVLPCVSSPTCT